MKWLKVGAVVFASVIITTLAIDAADTLQGSSTTLFGQLIATETSGCPAGMVAVTIAQTFKCVDIYEASVGVDCPHQNPKNELESRENVTSANCQSVSKAGEMPWRFITREQANTACLRSGKRLITAAEWFMVAGGTPDNGQCNTDRGGAQAVGGAEQCVSAVGAYDTIGNVWEWTTDDVIDGRYDDRNLPESGYVGQVDASGMPTVTNSEPSDLFSEDYFWFEPKGAFGVLRGGFYSSKSDGGVYSVHAKTLPTSAGAAIGFRCVL